jgi:hypothetical protein
MKYILGMFVVLMMPIALISITFDVSKDFVEKLILKKFMEKE